MSLPNLKIENWDNFTSSEQFNNQFLQEILPVYVKECRWFGSKSSTIKRFSAEVIIPITNGKEVYYVLILEVLYDAAFSENYLLILGKVPTNKAHSEKALISYIETESGTYNLIDALYSHEFRNCLFDLIVSESSLDQGEGLLTFNKGQILSDAKSSTVSDSKILNAEQSNTTLVYNDSFYLKIYRKLFRDANPDYELTYFLSEQTDFQNCPRFAGSITWSRTNSYEVTIGLMQGKIENKGDAWVWMLDEVKKFYENTSKNGVDINKLDDVALYKPTAIKSLSELTINSIGESTLKWIEKLALRTAEMHIALFKERYTRRFVPKVFNTDYKAWLLNRLIYQFDRRFHLMEDNLHKLKGEAREYAQQFLSKKQYIKDRILNFHSSRLNSMRIRIHGDYHLGQVIMDEDDFYILDFEGEPESTIRDRKVKQPPIKDVAGMFRSFHYAIYATIFDEANKFSLTKEEQFKAGEKYYAALVGVFLDKYLETAFKNGLDIGYHDEIDFLLRYHILEKGIYELGYELNARPDWVIIPLKGVLQIINDDLNGE